MYYYVHAQVRKPSLRDILLVIVASLKANSRPKLNRSSYIFDWPHKTVEH